MAGGLPQPRLAGRALLAGFHYPAWFPVNQETSTHAIHGKTHYFYGPCSSYVKLLEGIEVGDVQMCSRLNSGNSEGFLVAILLLTFQRGNVPI